MGGTCTSVNISGAGLIGTMVHEFLTHLDWNTHKRLLSFMNSCLSRWVALVQVYILASQFMMEANWYEFGLPHLNPHFLINTTTTSVIIQTGGSSTSA